MTIRLYDQDAYMTRFEATVLSCTQESKGWIAELDRTAFFPEGGGQGADHGRLGEAQVLDVHEKSGHVLHTLDRPLNVGEKVQGEIDWARRFSMMQQHTGEHIFSGLTCRRFSCDNVGFHIGSEMVTMDFNCRMTWDDVMETERLANEIVWKNVPVKAWYPSPEELSEISYRSKKEIDGDLRIVSIEGADTCACCGTHVSRTGSVGQIKVLDLMNYKSGVRVSILCGARALEAENGLLLENRAVSHALSAKPGTLEVSVQRILQERDQLRHQIQEMAEAELERQITCQASRDIRCVWVRGLSSASLRHAAGRAAKGARAGIVLTGDDRVQVALSSECMDVRPLGQKLFEHFGGKGGGGKDMVQGSWPGQMDEEGAALVQSLVQSYLSAVEAT
ncbi:MAG: alanyl-tRNA editing protein [Clostridia bacterium]|nr:alanyl-tRNA editing protein [Clostridia bacterium]